MARIRFTEKNLPDSHFILWTIHNKEADFLKNKVVRPLDWWLPVIRQATNDYIKNQRLDNQPFLGWFQPNGFKYLIRDYTSNDHVLEFYDYLSKSGHIIIDPPGKLRVNGPDLISFYHPNYQAAVGALRAPFKYWIEQKIKHFRILMNKKIDQSISAISVDQEHTNHKIEQIMDNVLLPENPISRQQLAVDLYKKLLDALEHQAVIECVYLWYDAKIIIR